MNRRTFIAKGLLPLSAFFFIRRGFKIGSAEAAVAKGPLESKPPKDKKMVKQRHKVVSVHSEKATNWDFKTYPYVDYINEDMVKNMLNEGIQSLTETKTPSDAWHTLFNMYKAGDVVAIKPNFNDLYNGFNGFVASPAVINAILDGLVKALKIPPRDIVVYDCTRIIPDEFRHRIHFPVNYIEPFGSSFIRKVKYKAIGNPMVQADLNHEIKMSSDVKDKSGRHIKCYIPKIITSSTHIINVPILKSHQFISHSGALKNHYGTVRFSDGHTGPEYLHPPIIHESIVDINSHEQIRSKTRLIVMDALYGRINKKGGSIERWNIFKNKSPNRLFLSRDPVALDSVSLKFLDEELKSRGDSIYSHDYLHIAHERGLGVHEDALRGMNFKQIEFHEIEI